MKLFMETRRHRTLELIIRVDTTTLPVSQRQMSWNSCILCISFFLIITFVIIRCKNNKLIFYLPNYMIGFLDEPSMFGLPFLHKHVKLVGLEKVTFTKQSCAFAKTEREVGYHSDELSIENSGLDINYSPTPKKNLKKLVTAS